MIPVLPDDIQVNTEIDRGHFLNVPRHIQTISLSDESIAPGFRGTLNTLQAIEEELAKHLKQVPQQESEGTEPGPEIAPQSADTPRSASDVLKAMPGHACTERPHDSLDTVRNYLRNVVRSLHKPDLSIKFLDPALSDQELLEVVSHLPSAIKSDFLRRLHYLARQDPSFQEFLGRRLDDIMCQTTLTERVEILQEFLYGAEKGDKVSKEFAVAVCEASRSSRVLEALVAKVGAARIFKCKDNDLSEYAARATLGPLLRELDLPSILPNEVDVAKSIGATYKDLETALKKVLEYAKKQDVSNTEIAARISMAAQYNLEYLQYHVAPDMQPEDLRQVVNLIASKAQLEFRYGILITHDIAEKSEPASARSWSEKDITDIGAVLATIPEGKLLFAPGLIQIGRVAESEGDEGAYHSHGTIEIADTAINNDQIAREHGGVSSLRVALAHQLGHVLQLGLHEPSFASNPQGGTRFNCGELKYGFDDFAKLSDWQAINRVRYKISRDGYIILDGQKYAMGVPITHRGENIVLVTDRWELYSHSASARFPRADISETSPWEDYAESFVDYCLASEQLIMAAPKKFQHLEQKFRAYVNHKDLTAQLVEALKKE